MLYFVILLTWSLIRMIDNDVSGTNHEIVFGPYNAHYPKLETHLMLAGINSLINKWDQCAVVWPVPQTHPQAVDDCAFLNFFSLFHVSFHCLICVRGGHI